MTSSTDTTDIQVEERTGWFDRLRSVQGLQMLLLVLLLVVLFTILAPDSFFTAPNIRAIILNTSILAVLGVGQTFVIITAGIDLSVGAVLVFSSVVASKAMTAYGGDGWEVVLVGFAVAIGCGLAWGIVNGLLVAKAEVPPLIATLGTLGAALGLAQVITAGVDLRGVPAALADTIGVGNVAGYIPILSLVCLVPVILGGILLHFTRFGTRTRAVGSNEEAGRRVGINVDMHLIKVYALSGALAGLGGILSLAYFQTTTISGQSQTNLNVITGVVIGGTSLFGGIGTIFGTVMGLFVPSILQNGFVIVGIQPFWQQVVVGIVLVTAVFYDQRMRRARERGRSGSLLTDWVTRRTRKEQKTGVEV